MSTVIEIDGVRHRLVEDNDRGGSCYSCSLSDLCPTVEGVHVAQKALCILFEDFDHHFEIEKGNSNE